MNCIQCGKELNAQRSTARFCSGACKMRNKRGATPVTLNPVVTVTKHNVPLTDAEKYIHLMFEECDGTNCPGGFQPNWKNKFKSKQEVKEKVKI